VQDTPIEALLPFLKKQRDSFHAQGFPDADSRRDRLLRMAKMLKKYDSAICEALREDFGSRGQVWSRIADVVTLIGNIQHCIDHLDTWMEDEHFDAMSPFKEAGAKAMGIYQPKGVVGIIGPWNFPIHLVLVPAFNAIAAGNRVMLKPSELTPNSTRVLQQGITEFFDETEAVVISGGTTVSAAFSSLAFDHLVFTGSTAVGRLVMRSAAENLVPVTLELGGKSPAIFRPDCKLLRSCRRLIAAKVGNSGQWCVSPDHVYVPTNMVDDFVEGCKTAFAELYPTVENNSDYTSVINDKHYQRLQHMMDDANKRGHQVVECNPANETYDQAANRKMLLKFIINPDRDSAVMAEEIFGPIIAVIPYENVDDVISGIMAGPRPLALYYYGEDGAEQQSIIRNTISGGLCINDSGWQVSSPDMPIGGIGDSGMGRYHGVYGFREFSHLRSVMIQTANEEATQFYNPPYSDMLVGMLGQTMDEIES